ncbi:MAG: O-antigen ligase family protein [Azospirillaceae bacterium]|nr:O-antigen ligase family protein [Azospirillaceae bacterium]
MRVTPDRLLDDVLAAFAFLAPVIAATAPVGEAPLLIVASVLGIAVARWRDGYWSRPDPVLMGLMLVFLGWGWASTLWAATPRGAWTQAWQLSYTFIPAVWFLGVARDTSDWQRRMVGSAFLAGVGVAALVTALNVYDHLLVHYALRLKANDFDNLVLIDRNMVVLSALVWVAVALAWHRGWRWLAAVLPVALWLVQIGAESKSAKLGSTLALAACAAMLVRPRLAWRGLGAVIVIVFVAALPIALSFQALGLRTDPDITMSMRHRAEIWSFAAHRALERPWLGWGLDGSRTLPGVHEVVTLLPWEQAQVMPVHPHDAYLQVWLELGAVGAALALGFSLLVWYRVGRLPSPQRECGVAVIAGFLGMVWTSYGIWQTWWSGTMLIVALLFSLTLPRTQPAAVV